VREETILRTPEREIAILAASDGLSVTRGRCVGGERIAGRHLHREHADAFYVLEGELTFELGPESEEVTVGAGRLVAVPAGVVHSVRNAGDRDAAWLTIHAPDGGFADFMRGVRDGVDVEWDIAPPPPDGGLSADEAVVRRSAPRR
jgi:mannose-6-phosphate isomerase-like protein (cupin superfamily)